MSNRVQNDRQQQRIEQQRQMQAKDAGKSAEGREKFAKAMAQQKNETGSAKKEGEAQAGKQVVRQSSQAAILARQGAQVQAKFASLMNNSGNQNLQQTESEANNRMDDVKENETTVREDGERADMKDMVRKDAVEKVDPDQRQRQQHQGGGGQQQGQQESGAQQNALGGPEGIGAAGSAGPAQQAQGAQGANAPQLPAPVLEALVKRVLVGVDEAGMGNFVVQLKEDVLGGSTVHIQARDGKISAKFTTNDKNTARLIKASEGALARVLARRGMSLESMEVEAR